MLKQSNRRRAALSALGAAVLSARAASADVSATAGADRQSLEDAWWTGPIVAASAATLPKGHALIEPYVYDVITRGRFDDDGNYRSTDSVHSLGSLTYMLYGVTDEFTAGLIPTFGFNDVSTGSDSSRIGLGDVTLQGQYRLTQFREGGWMPTMSLVLQETLPTGKYDRLGARLSDGLGSGAYTTTLAVHSQYYFWLPTGRILRTRFNVSYALPNDVDVADTSVYGTRPGFRGRAQPGNAFMINSAWEYSVTRNWVLALDVIYQHDDNTRVRGQDLLTVDGQPQRVDFQADSGSSWRFGLAPAIEYNWTSRVGVIVGARWFAAGRNTGASVIRSPLSIGSIDFMPHPLVIRCGGFGEVVLLTALIEQLHLRTGEPVDVISSGPWAKPLLEGLQSVGEVRVLASRNTPYWIDFRQQQLVRWLRARGAGPTWCCDNHDSGRELLRRAAIADGYVCDSRSIPFDMTEHFVNRWIRLANLTPPALQGRLPQTARRVPGAARLQISATQASGHREWLRRHDLHEGRYFAIQAGNKRNTRSGSRGRRTNTKHWPEERWVELIRAIRDMYPDDAILLLGVRREHALNEDIVRSANVSSMRNLAGDLPVPVLLPLLRGARGMFSVDTGPAHAAAALGCPTVALFGEASPLLYRPGGAVTPAVALTGEIDGRPSIRGITVQSVVAAWTALSGERDSSLSFPYVQSARRHSEPDCR